MPETDLDADELAKPLKRKRTNTNDSEQPVATRRRVACESCRLRKIRCSRDRPKCSFCNTREGDCIYLETSEDKLTLDPATRLIVRRLDEIANSVQRIGNFRATAAVPRLRWSTQLSEQSAVFEDEQIGQQAAKDYLTVPSCQATADTVLTWPIFQGCFETDSLIRHHYQTAQQDAYGESEDSTAEVTHDQFLQQDLKSVPSLIDRFLQNVHTKNPILDVPALVLWGRETAQRGFTFDARSCLVLVACALGSVSRPFNDTLHDFQTYSNFGSPDQVPDCHSTFTQKEDLAAGERYYILACRRLGLLKHTILGTQCHFFAAVYLMYTFRPLEAWRSFYQASSFYQFYLRSVGGPTSEEPNYYDMERLQRISRQERRLEQTIYHKGVLKPDPIKRLMDYIQWSCFKSEIEMRVELPLALSTITSFEYPSLFPTPPTPLTMEHSEAVPTAYEASAWQKVIDATYGSNMRDLRGSVDLFNLPEDTQALIQHHGQLYNEQESWYYYLTEVALRRISNRIINSFYRVPRTEWLLPQRWITLAMEFAAQTTTWSDHLPAAMQTFDASPLQLLKMRTASDATPIDADGLAGRKDSVSKELSWCTENRLLEMRSWLYQPFLYCIIHQPQEAETSHQPWTALPEPRRSAFQDLVASGIECNLRILHWRALFHRHHGIWFDIRSVITAVITLCGLARSGNVQVPMCLFFDPSTTPEGPERSCGTHQLPCISFETIFDRLKYWEDETPDIRESRLLIEQLVQTVRSELSWTATT